MQCEAPSCLHFCSGKAIIMTHSDSVFVALGIQVAMRMHQMPSVACTVVKYFSILSNKKHDFRKKKVIKHETCVSFSLQMLSETFLILNELSEMCSKLCECTGLQVKLSLFLSLNFLERFSKKYSNIKFHENPSRGSGVGSCGRTNIMQLIVAFRNFANGLINLQK